MVHSKFTRCGSSLCVAATVGMALLIFANAAIAQTVETEPPSRFVIGPLAWTPIIALRDAGVDSNVFNSPRTETPKQDVTGSLTPSVDSVLRLGLMRLVTQGRADFLYFERYANERAINGRVSGRLQFPTTRVHPVLSASWERTKERNSNEIDIRAPRTEKAYSVGLGTEVTPGSSLTVTAGISDLRYDQGADFHGVDLATILNRQSTSANMTFRGTLTPLTRFIVVLDGARDEFTSNPSHDSDNLRGSAGFEFAPDAIIRGRAVVGYHKMIPRGSDPSVTFGGWTTAGDLSYTLLGRTRITGRASRGTSYSALDSRPFYLSTFGGLEITHNLVGPVDLDFHSSREILDYAATPFQSERIDYADAMGGGVVIRLSMQTRIGFYYDDTHRHSSAGAEWKYTRQHVYTSLTYGF